MEILLNRITIEEKESLLKATPEELELKLDLADLVSEVELRLRHSRVENEVFLNGTVIFKLEFTCARCLESYVREFETPLSLVVKLVPAEQIRDADATEDEFVLHPLSQEQFSLDRHVRDLIGLEVPLKPLCREDCAGLCPQCGTNLNESGCDCRRESSDPRWDGLRKLGNAN